MDDIKFKELVLQQLRILTEGQAKLEAGQAKLEAGQKAIRNELKYVWEDIKKIDNRLSAQEEETYMLKQMK